LVPIRGLRGSFVTPNKIGGHESAQTIPPSGSAHSKMPDGDLLIGMVTPQPRSSPMIPSGSISEILDHKGNAVWTVSPDNTVFEAIQLMSEKNIGALLVTERGKLVGIVSERDYTRKVALKGKTSKDLRVRDIISDKVLSVTPQNSVEECMRLMTENRVRHLPVLDGERLMGVVSIGDLVNWTISAQSTTIRQLETYISGYPG
jgi:CBS domain-containing protein